MKILKAASMACGLALMGMALSTTASADEWNKKTTITFSGPVEIPGVHLKGWAVLPAGTYVFKLLDSSSDRHIVQIFNKDENVVYATILAIPNYRLRATDKTVMTFRERPAGEPEALRAWFYPGANWGEEFVYPKAKAMEIAVATKTPVLFTETDTVEVTEPIRTADHSVVVAMKAAPVMAVQPSGNQVAMMEVVTPLPQPTMVVQPAATLPTTAGVVPFFALFGFVALVGAIGAGVAVRRLS